MSLTTYFFDSFSDPVVEFNRLFDAAWDARAPGSDLQQRNNSNTAGDVLRPRMDLHTSNEKDEVTATFELPGMKKEDVNIEVNNNRLVVSGQSTITDTLDKDGYAVRERRFGKFSRVLPLPHGTKSEAIKATMENGVLTVRFPRTHPDQAPKKVTVS